MNGYPYRAITGWIAALALAWLGFSSPWPVTWNLLLAAFVVAAAVVLILTATRRIHARMRASQAMLKAADASLAALPGDLRRNTPLVLVIGDNAPAFGDALIRITDTAIWVRADEPTRLAHLADALSRWREGQGPDAVACLVGADNANDPAVLAATLRSWRSAIGEASRAVGYPLPVCLGVYAAEAGGPPDACPWFGISGSGIAQGDALRAQLGACLAPYPLAVLPADRKARAYRAARLEALAGWACEALLPVLCGDGREGRDGWRSARPADIAAFGVIALPGVPAADSLYAGFVARTTRLLPAGRGGAAPACYPLPEPLLRGIPRQPVRRALAHAFVWLAAAFCAAAAASAWQNRALVARVVADMARYRAIGAEHDAARVNALQAVKRDRAELEHYARNGVPPRLGLGFYRGATLVPQLDALIAAYQPPAPPPATVELDSLSLFRSGSATLNPGSNRVLIGALEMIKAHPGKRVLVAGHTDSVGNPRANLRLSEARAAAVRDWLADASGLPPTDFAIQGYGDTRPRATNDTEAGRAANRRVEITLVPDCRDDRAISGHPACSSQKKEQ